VKSEQIYLHSILDSIKQIEEYTKVGHDDFIAFRYWQDAIVRQLINIGEAVKHVTPASRKSHPEIAWQKISGLQDVLTHDYLETDYEMVWIIAVNDLNTLKTTVEELLSWY